MKGLLLLFMLAAGLGGCNFGREAPVEVLDSIAQPLNEPNTLVNPQTGVQITVPANWIKAGDDLRRNADIYASYPSRGLYVSVLSESDSTLRQFPLKDNSEQYRWLIEEELDSYEGATEITDFNRLDGLPAVQYEIRGTVDGSEIVYLHTTVQGETSYYQVVGWTTADRYSENREALQNVIQSFDASPSSEN